MSRSYRHTPAFKIGGSSDKSSKQTANRKFRRSRPRQNEDVSEKYYPKHIREVSDRWCFSSDGGAYYCSRLANSNKDEDKESLKRYMRK